MIILLDGSKGAGKSSVSKILLSGLKNVDYLSLDIERHALQNQEKSHTELNKEAFQNILDKTQESLRNGKNVIIDSGLIKERVPLLENLALGEKANLYKFFLKAPYEILLDRVRSRDRKNGKTTNVERFKEVFDLTTAKNFDGFTIIETDALSVEEIADRILKIVS